MIDKRLNYSEKYNKTYGWLEFLDIDDKAGDMDAAITTPLPVSEDATMKASIVGKRYMRAKDSFVTITKPNCDLFNQKTYLTP